MTHPDVFAPAGWSIAAPDVLRPWRWLSQWVEDPLERAVMVLIAVVSVVLVGVLVTGEDVSASTARDTCVMSAVYDARAFASVLGDDRPIGVSFAEDLCGRR